MFSTDRLMQRCRATNRRTYDRNVRIAFEVGQQDNVNEPGENIRRSNRRTVPVRRYNMGEVTCAVCAKNFRTLSLHLYTGAIACSFDCFKKHRAQRHVI